MTSIDITEPDENGLQAFLMTLRPRCSADPRVAYGFFGILGFIWLCAGIFIASIASMGGWPVFGFIARDGTSVYAPDRGHETISITQSESPLPALKWALNTAKHFLLIGLRPTIVDQRHKIGPWKFAAILRELKLVNTCLPVKKSAEPEP